MALTKYLRTQPASSGNAETVRRALPAAVQVLQEAATHQESPPLRRTGSIDDSDGRAEAVDQLAKRRRRSAKDGPEERVYRQLRRQNLDEGRREEEIV